MCVIYQTQRATQSWVCVSPENASACKMQSPLARCVLTRTCVRAFARDFSRCCLLLARLHECGPSLCTGYAVGGWSELRVSISLHPMPCGVSPCFPMSGNTGRLDSPIPTSRAEILLLSPDTLRCRPNSGISASSFARSPGDLPLWVALGVMA